MHPSHLPDSELLADCDTTRQRRSGPGGQHRNKVETAIRLTHLPTGLSAQASERRSQAENLKQALFRLRLELAINYRDEIDLPERTAKAKQSELWQKRCKNGRIAINPSHPDFPALLADALDCLAVSKWEHKQAAEALGISASQLIKLLKNERRAFTILNRRRNEAGLSSLS